MSSQTPLSIPQNAIQTAANKQATFVDQLRICLQRPTVWEKCRDLTKLLTHSLPSPANTGSLQNQR